MDAFLMAHGLAADDLIAFKDAWQPLRLKKGTKWIRPGQIARHIALIESGCLRTYHIDESGQEVTTAFNVPATFCGAFHSFYTQSPAFEYIEAITESDVYLLSFTALQQMYKESFAMNVFGRKILEQACIERDLRLKKILHLSALEKYNWFLENFSSVYQVASVGSIASFLGMKPETLSRVRRKMRPGK
jgi:CRP-like cAMP-binding protein